MGVGVLDHAWLSLKLSTSTQSTAPVDLLWRRRY
jgi:hypothetical protein